jgi:hypothetical protein
MLYVKMTDSSSQNLQIKGAALALAQKHGATTMQDIHVFQNSLCLYKLFYKFKCIDQTLFLFSRANSTLAYN